MGRAHSLTDAATLSSIFYALHKGYNSERIRELLNRKAVKPMIPVCSDQRRDEDFDREAHRERNLVERLINRLRQRRRIATRYEKRVESYSGRLTLAALVL